MNFATSLILYGQAIGDETIRDLGIYWHSTEAEAIRQYWFDQDGEVFPDGFQQSCVGMVWGDGASYGTWWTANPEEIHGINFLPINGGSLYLGRDTDYVKRNIANLNEANRNFHASRTRQKAQLPHGTRCRSPRTQKVRPRFRLTT